MDKKVEFFSITILEKISKRFSIPRYLLTICPHSDIFLYLIFAMHRNDSVGNEVRETFHGSPEQTRLSTQYYNHLKTAYAFEYKCWCLRK